MASETCEKAKTDLIKLLEINVLTSEEREKLKAENAQLKTARTLSIAGLNKQVDDLKALNLGKEEELQNLMIKYTEMQNEAAAAEADLIQEKERYKTYMETNKEPLARLRILEGRTEEQRRKMVQLKDELKAQTAYAESIMRTKNAQAQEILELKKEYGVQADEVDVFPKDPIPEAAPKDRTLDAKDCIKLKARGDNYTIWARMIKSQLQAAGVWYVCKLKFPTNGDWSEDQVKEKKARYNEDDGLTKMFLLKTLQEELLMETQGCETSKAIWEELERMFMPKTERTKTAMYDKWEGWTFDNSRTLIENYRKLQLIRQQGTQAGIYWNDFCFIRKFLGSAPARYETVKQYFAQRPESEHTVEILYQVVEAVIEKARRPGDYDPRGGRQSTSYMVSGPASSRGRGGKRGFSGRRFQRRSFGNSNTGKNGGKAVSNNKGSRVRGRNKGSRKENPERNKENKDQPAMTNGPKESKEESVYV